MLRPIYTKHFAERFLERSGDMNILRGLKKEIQSRFCEHVFDCLVISNPKRVHYKGFKAVLFFEETTKQLFVKTFY